MTNVIDSAIDSAGSADLTDLVTRLAEADLAGDFAGEFAPEALVERVLHRVVGLVPGATEAGASVLLAPSGAAEHFATGTLADACAMLEEKLGEGPGREAAARRTMVRVDDMAADRRWPDYATRAAALGVASQLICELPCAVGPRGMFVMVSDRAHAFAPTAQLIFANVANRVAVAVAHAEKLRQLRRAIDSRQTIGQACGILIERHKVRPERAFEMLVRASQRNHLKLRDLAVRVVETGQEPDAIRY